MAQIDEATFKTKIATLALKLGQAMETDNGSGMADELKPTHPLRKIKKLFNFSELGVVTADTDYIDAAYAGKALSKGDPFDIHAKKNAYVGGIFRIWTNDLLDPDSVEMPQNTMASPETADNYLTVGISTINENGEDESDFFDDWDKDKIYTAAVVDSAPVEQLLMHSPPPQVPTRTQTNTFRMSVTQGGGASFWNNLSPGSPPNGTLIRIFATPL